jgi:hypothetical protein
MNSTPTTRRPLLRAGGATGVKAVELSTDGGGSWKATTLGRDEGKYRFRQWQAEVTLPAGAAVIMARCTNSDGLAQPSTLNWNPSGFMHNAIESTRVTVVA